MPQLPPRPQQSQPFQQAALRRQAGGATTADVASLPTASADQLDRNSPSESPFTAQRHQAATTTTATALPRAGQALIELKWGVRLPPTSLMDVRVGP